MLHHMPGITFFHRFGNQITLNISSVYEIVLIITVGSCNRRFAEYAMYGNTFSVLGNRDNFFGYLFSENTVYQFFQIAVTGSMEFDLSV